MDYLLPCPQAIITQNPFKPLTFTSDTPNLCVPFTCRYPHSAPVPTPNKSGHGQQGAFRFNLENPVTLKSPSLEKTDSLMTMKVLEGSGGAGPTLAASLTIVKAPEGMRPSLAGSLTIVKAQEGRTKLGSLTDHFEGSKLDFYMTCQNLYTTSASYISGSTDQ